MGGNFEKLTKPRKLGWLGPRIFNTKKGRIHGFVVFFEVLHPFWLYGQIKKEVHFFLKYSNVEDN